MMNEGEAQRRIATFRIHHSAFLINFYLIHKNPSWIAITAMVFRQVVT